ncbi:glycine betaine ABC transporter substrate-binding protein [Novispirillum itersonii]|uniref:glycine betaine ABC transporter substrate-binding protein n=1 Tax=Novispirillum itersonii TaxID=189 RepID=UPI0003811529|nr:glycine betaine ABC transporter substrate-binding protein [Novispirillum itersonii]
MMTTRRRFLGGLGTAVAGVAAGVGTAPSAVAQSRRTVRLGVTDLSFHRATAAAVTLVLQRMGFTVERRYALHEANFEALRAGEVGMVASAWIPFSHGVYKALVEEVVPTRELGLHYEPYALWGVPDYVPEDAVSAVPDLLKPDVRQKMTPLIQGIGPGAGITRFSQRMMQDYGLSAAGYTFQTGTQRDCFDAFEAAVRERRWVVVPLWHPQYLHNRYVIRELEDPKGLLGGKDRAVLLAREDILQGFTPQEVAALNAITLSNAIVSRLDDLINTDGMDPDAGFRHWLGEAASQPLRAALAAQGVTL